MSYAAQDVRARRAAPTHDEAAPSYPPVSGPADLEEKPYTYVPPWADATGPPPPEPASGRPLGFKGYQAGTPGTGWKSWREGWVFYEKPKVYAKGKRREGQSELWAKFGGGLDLSEGEIKLLVVVCLVAMFVRYWRIWHPSSVVFDEVHFGGFASKYIKSAFFMDVHPPLAKMLIALVAWISGFNGDFKFKDIGDDYIESRVPYVAMRLLPATMGVLIVPLAYCTLRMLSLRPASALLGSALITFENGLITQSRLILLDSPLLFFTALTAFFHVGFSNEDARRGFTPKWWAWLALTGVALGAVASCKWVGLFTIATVGVVTVKQLWDLLGDLRVPMPLLARHFIARAICLIAIPIVFYMAMFEIHFLILSNSGDGDAFMSSEFQHTLRGHGMADTFADVMLGSNVTLRHLNTQGGYLHSHPHYFPGGSKQQQITLYPHVDTNNIWTILDKLQHDGSEQKDDLDAPHDPPRYITSGMTIRLHHPETKKRLHSHDVRSSVTEVDYQNEVSGYGFEDFPGDVNDEWVVEIVGKETDNDYYATTRLRTLRTKFRLRHLLQGCYLFSHKVKLPDWGFEQQEVTCNKNPTMANSLWYIETATHATQQNDKRAEKTNYRRPGFLSKFWELQQVMWATNAGLTDRHAYDSRPQHWPILRRGINFWVQNHRQVYLIGNPFIWWLSTMSILVYVMMRGLVILRQKRGYKDLQNTTVAKYDGLAGYLVLGWALHYLPFFLMNRQLFLHHYFPALYFSILLICTLFDLATTKLSPRLRMQVVGVLLIMSIWAWWHFSPLTYAGDWTRKQCELAKWRSSWDFSCGDFYETLDDYHPKPVATTTEGIIGPNADDQMSTSAAAVAPIQNVFHDPHAADDVPKSSAPPNQNPDPGLPGVAEIERAKARVAAKAAEEEAREVAMGRAGRAPGQEDVQLPQQPGATPGVPGKLQHLAGEGARAVKEEERRDEANREASAPAA